MRYTVAVDFDGVLHSYVSPWVNAHTIPDPPCKGAISWLCYISGRMEVIIFTTRGKTWRGRRAVRRWLWEHGYSEPGAECWGDLQIRVTDKKPPALVYIDDRAYRFLGENWPTVDEVHRLRPWNK